MNSIFQSALLIATVFSFSANAQTTPAATAPTKDVSAPNATTHEGHAAIESENVFTLATRTAIRLTLTNPLSTKTAVSGEQFPLTVSEDIKVNNHVLIPMGTPALGEVIHAQKAKGFGKAGELLVTVRHIDLNGMKIKMRSFQPLQGNDKTSTALATSQIPVVGLFSGFVKGGDIEMPAQTQVQAQTAAETIIHLKKEVLTPPSNNTTTGDSK